MEFTPPTTIKVGIEPSSAYLCSAICEHEAVSFEQEWEGDEYLSPAREIAARITELGLEMCNLKEQCQGVFDLCARLNMELQQLKIETARQTNASHQEEALQTKEELRASADGFACPQAPGVRDEPLAIFLQLPSLTTAAFAESQAVFILLQLLTSVASLLTRRTLGGRGMKESYSYDRLLENDVLNSSSSSSSQVERLLSEVQALQSELLSDRTQEALDSATVGDQLSVLRSEMSGHSHQMEALRIFMANLLRRCIVGSSSKDEIDEAALRSFFGDAEDCIVAFQEVLGQAHTASVSSSCGTEVTASTTTAMMFEDGTSPRANGTLLEGCRSVRRMPSDVKRQSIEQLAQDVDEQAQFYRQEIMGLFRDLQRDWESEALRLWDVLDTHTHEVTVASERTIGSPNSDSLGDTGSAPHRKTTSAGSSQASNSPAVQATRSHYSRRCPPPIYSKTAGGHRQPNTVVAYSSIGGSTLSEVARSQKVAAGTPPNVTRRGLPYSPRPVSSPTNSARHVLPSRMAKQSPQGRQEKIR